LRTIGTPLAWTCFGGLVLAMLLLDLGVFHKRAHAVSIKESAIWSGVWVSLSLFFNWGLYMRFGFDRALEFTTGYLIEKALALDNIFVFVVIFAAFRVPTKYQHRVLFWGVFGAFALRALFIFAGGELLQHFHWAMYVFGAILLITGLRLLFQKESAHAPEKSPLTRALGRWFSVTPDIEGHKFMVRRDGKLRATPLLLALISVELADVLFALDSIPAVFAVTSDPFIVFSSNIFAIMGLRSLYFLLANVIGKFVYLKYGLSIVLIFIGTKMAIVDIYDVPILISLGVIVGVVGASIVISLAFPPRDAAAERDARV
jgi:tellurite resistance protein TerC